jgi:hypothetical protein
MLAPSVQKLNSKPMLKKWSFFGKVEQNINNGNRQSWGWVGTAVKNSCISKEKGKATQEKRPTSATKI